MRRAENFPEILQFLSTAKNRDCNNREKRSRYVCIGISEISLTEIPTQSAKKA